MGSESWRTGPGPIGSRREPSIPPPTPASLAVLLAQLPPRPPAELDRALDATAACLARHGLARTTMTDVAREMKVARSTLYRQVGSIEEAAWALCQREAYRGLDSLALALRQAGAEALVRALAAFVRFSTEHPVLSKLRQDEPGLMGEVVTQWLPTLVRYSTSILVPVVEEGMADGSIRPADPRVVAGWICRVTLALVAAPPEEDLDDVLGAMLLPALEPAGPGRAVTGSRSRRATVSR